MSSLAQYKLLQKKVADIILSYQKTGKSIVLDSFRKQFSSSQVFPIEDVLKSAHWLLADGVKFKNAIINIDDNYTGYIIWESGIWESGTWFRGYWWDGLWIDGIWKSGVWHRGHWLNGIWERGTWHDGMWESGEWLDGEWFTGKINGTRSKVSPVHP